MAQDTNQQNTVIADQLYWVCENKHKEPRDRNDVERACSTCGKPMTKMINEDKIKRMVAALMTHQESAEKIGNVAEAAQFAQQITRLLTKYELSEDDVRDPEIGVELMDPIFMKLTTSFNRIDWMVRLATSVADATGSRVLFPADRKNGQMFFVGTKKARKAAVAAFVGLARLGLTLSRAELVLHRRNGGGDEKSNRGWRPSFAEAFTDNVISRLGRGSCPIGAINAFLGDAYGRVDQMTIEREDAVRHQAAADAGKRHGQSVDINVEVN